MASAITAIDLALYQIDYEWLESQHPTLLDAITKEVVGGKSPADVKHQVFRSTTADRAGLAMRCFNAAAHIEIMRERQTA